MRYDQKSDSKMISSITTLGYLVMVLLYYWPWGGWRSSSKRLLKEWIFQMASLENVKDFWEKTLYGPVSLI